MKKNLNKTLILRLKASSIKIIVGFKYEVDTLFIMVLTKNKIKWKITSLMNILKMELVH